MASFPSVQVYPHVVYVPDAQVDLSTAVEPSAADAITKIVIGEVGDEKFTLPVPLPRDLRDLFPQLAHLHLWNLENLETIPALPSALRCLDVRGCPRLAALPKLPDTLDTLVLESCVSLRIPADLQRKDFPQLADLSIRGSGAIDEEWLHAVLQGAPNLRVLDASGCEQITSIPQWAPLLEDVRLDGCTGLADELPPWPTALRRIGLRGAKSLKRVPDFHDRLDYIDLARAESLEVLPQRLGNPATLFLFGSGLREPPVSEQGTSADTNVAETTRRFFEDVALTGRGEVKRCKLLVLGNGAAGKTCLALALVGKDPEDAKKVYGSTHGVQFWDWPEFKATIDGETSPVNLHVWDFGGQEIYHNTHRLFMGTGSVFVVVWNPEQDGRQPEAVDGEYEDEWRPLRYWVDLIHQACPNRPLIAIVCSHHRTSTEELKARLGIQLGEDYETKYGCFFVDSLERKRAPAMAGQFPNLEKWIRESVGRVVEAQGTTVPTYWEIGQDLVEGWMKRSELDAQFAAAHNEMSLDAFGAALDAATHAAANGSNAERYPKLAASLADGRFALTPERVARTLRFLTQSGWVYWDEQLFEKRVIIGQAWALRGIYAVLERRQDRTIYRTLKRDRGRFTRSGLGVLSWNTAYTEEEQKLLLSFMLRCGLCFKLRDAEQAWSSEDVYVSFEHLPTSAEAGLDGRFRERFPDAVVRSAQINCDTMHKQHWQALLVDAGAQYGAKALYAVDGLFIENEGGEKLLIRCMWRHGDTPDDRPGFGATIEIAVGGGKADERLAAEEAWVRQLLPDEDGRAKRLREAGWRGGGGRTEGDEIEEVFISYTWDPPPERGGPGVPAGYEVPAVAIERWLVSQGWVPLRDKSRIETGDDIRRFMTHGASRPRVVVVHSDKYWRSPCCVFECKELLEALSNREDRMFEEVVVAIEHHDSRVTDENRMREYAATWASYSGYCPAGIWDSPEEMKARAPGIVWDFGKRLSKLANLNIRWDEGEKAVFAKLAAIFKKDRARREQGKKGR